MKIISFSLLRACKVLYPKLPFIIWLGQRGNKFWTNLLFDDLKPDYFIANRDDNPDISEILNAVKTLLDENYNTSEANKKILANDVNALLGLGEAYRHLRKYQKGHSEEKYQEAIDIFQKVIKIDPSNSLAHAHLGRALYDSGKLYEAIKALKQAVKLNIGHPESWTYACLGSVYSDMKRYAEAIKAFKQAIAIKPSVELYRELGDIYYYEIDQYDEAIEVYKQALRLETDNINKAELYRDLGCAYRESMQYSKSIKAYKQAIQLVDSKEDDDPSEYSFVSEWAHYGLGQSFLEMGQKSKAIEEYQILKKLNSEHAEMLHEEIYK